MEEIKFVSNLIRTKIKILPTEVNLKTTENNLHTSFWKTCRDIFNRATNSLPTFSVFRCTEYFRIILTGQSMHSDFKIPGWIPKLPQPEHPYNDTPPTYQEVARAVRRAKTSASGSVFDQLSIIILKRCPILRTVLHRIILECWRRRQIPACWKQGATVLIYKKGDPGDPANFRPITLQSSWDKILSTILKNRIYDFLDKNGYIDRKIQKGFWPKVDGVSEHTEQLTHIITDAKRHSRSIVVTLLDLRNAFGEVHHSLIRSVMEYHHLPSIFRDLFDAIYTDSHIKIAVSKEWTSNLGVRKGVLQGDPCSPLLFNPCFNTLMRIFREKKLEKLGYIWGPDGNSNECSWLQFADDAVVISNSVRDAQTLIDIFAAWCARLGMDIRLDKCCSYAAAKRYGVYTQFEPLLLINSQPVPAVSINESFTYLGKIFDFEMKNGEAKSAMIKKLYRLLVVTSSLKIKAQLKLKILKVYIHSQITHELKLYSFGETWIIQHLDSMCAEHIREWLRMPVSSCIKEFSSLPKNR